MPDDRSLRIGFVSTRFAGTDGVSLETEKWARVLEEMGHHCFYFCGECDRPDAVSMVVPEAHFEHPEIRRINVDLFDDFRRQPETSELVRAIRSRLRAALTEFVQGFDLELLIVENALAIPMNVPLGLALTEMIVETGIPTIGHHHDFVWERSRYSVGAAEDYLQAAFPPAMSSILHVVINSFAGRQLAYRTGMRSTLIPNVMDFDRRPEPPDGFAADMRETLEIGKDEFLLLQPTRIVPRKRIERAIELMHRLEHPSVLLISHSAGDEGFEYQEYLADYSRALGVRVIFGDRFFSYERGSDAGGRKRYSLADAYRMCDLVTYPSSIEGFGNAFLEAIFYRKPIFMSTYDIYRADIAPKGFRVASFEEFVTRDVIREVRSILTDPTKAEAMVAENYDLAKKYYSYTVLRERLQYLIREAFSI